MDQRQTVQLGNHHVDHRGVIWNGLRHHQTFLPVGTLIDRKAALLQAISHKGSDLFVIFHHQDAHTVAYKNKGLSAKYNSDKPREVKSFSSN